MKTQNKFKALGLMSGTSLDGLDLACVELTFKNPHWSFEILAAETIKYSLPWQKKLSTAHLLPSAHLLALDADYGRYLGQCCTSFISKNKLKSIGLIASHGHTIFHQPNRGFTFQLGNGNALHALTGIPVVCDFRSLDVASGGQGAPLVPVGDKILFAAYDICLNLGGIANLSFERKEKRVAYDICFANMGLNYLSQKFGRPFDRNGEMAKSGKINKELLSQLNSIYSRMHSKRPSLGREGFEEKIQPLLSREHIPVSDRLRTFCESIANEIKLSIPPEKSMKLLATGGGAHNKFLIELLQEKLRNCADVVVPEKKIVDFKEAIVFALLGVLRLRGEINCLKSVTGATHDSCAGVLVGI